MIKRISFVFLAVLSFSVSAQPKLILHTEAVDSMLVWMRSGNLHSSVERLCAMPAHQLAEQTLYVDYANPIPLREALFAFNPTDTLAGAAYILPLAYKLRDSIDNFMEELKHGSLSEKAYGRVAHYFPAEFKPTRSYELFFSCVGWEWGDAQNIAYSISNGKHILDDKGTPTILFNVTIINNIYGNSAKERLNTFTGVLSHELFHAQLDDYRRAFWRKPTGDSVIYSALQLMLDEGIAHYVADGDYLRKSYSVKEKIREIEKAAFDTLAVKSSIFFDTTVSSDKRNQVVREGTFGKYWSKYICIPSLFMVYHIEQLEGIDIVRTCVKQGPAAFIRRYVALTKVHPELPALPSVFSKI